MAWRGKRAMRGLDEEIRDFIDHETQENVERGLSPEEARRQAMLKFGNVAITKEDARAVWIRVWLDQALQDARYTLRALRRNPAFGALIILTLAVAIGLNTATYSVFNAVVLRPLGYPHAERLVWLSTVGGDAEAGIVTAPDFADWREHATSFDRLVAYGTSDHTLATPAGGTRVRAVMITHDFWDLAAAHPASGRVPGTGERDVALLSSAFAQRWFPGDTNLIGRTVSLDGDPVTIVGILPAQFRFEFPASAFATAAGDADIYLPMTVSPARNGPIQLLSVVGRLKAGVPLEGAKAEIEAFRTRAARVHPSPFDDQRTLRVVPLHDQLIGGARPALLVLLGAVACVLLIACANAAHLLLARASVRHKEIAVRLSLGAGRPRVLRQLLVESLVLAVVACGAGLMLARAALAMMLRIDPGAMPRLAETTIDRDVLVVALGVSALTSVIFGLAPALAFWKAAPQDLLHGGRQGALPAGRGVGIRRLLVAAEVALALVLLIGAGLMLKSAARMTSYTAGFAPDRIVTASIELSGPQYSTPQRQLAFADALLGRLVNEPGVEAAAISTHGYMLTPALTVAGERPPAPEELARRAPIMINFSTAALRRVVGFRIERGRWFTDTEDAAVVNETLARRDFGGRDPVGRRIQLSEQGPSLTIVGVVSDLKYSKLDAPADPEVYVPYTRGADGLYGFTVLALARRDPLALAPAIRGMVAAIDRTQVPDRLMTMEQALADSIAPRRLNLFLLGTFAAVALFLAMIGTYAVMAYSVTQRRHEIGVRLALGAQRADVARLVVRQGMGITLGGILAGLAAATMLGRVLGNLLYEVEPSDPATFILVTMSLAAVAFAACLVPAVRAARIDPMNTLRQE